MKAIHVQPPASKQRNKAIPPDPKACSLKFDYSPSQDGIDHNLLILLHGFGDTKEPFAGLGKKLQLPQTATLSVQAPGKLPYFDNNYQWHTTIDLSTALPPSDPSRKKTLLESRRQLVQLVRHLIDHCQFNPSNIFLFGFSQGATAALDLCLFGDIRNLGGVVSISGYLLEEQRSDSKVEGGYGGYILVTQGDKDEVIGNKTTAERRFADIRRLCSPSADTQLVFIRNKGHAMPSTQEEMRTIHSFFGKYMPQRNLALENMSDVYPVVS